MPDPDALHSGRELSKAQRTRFIPAREGERTLAQGSRGRTEASVEGLRHLAVPRFVDDTVNRFSPAGGYRNHSERDKCRTHIKHTYQQRCDKCTYKSGGHTHKDITQTPQKQTPVQKRCLSMPYNNAGHAVIRACEHTLRHTITYTDTQSLLPSPELWIKMTQGLVERSNQAFIEGTSDRVLGRSKVKSQYNSKEVTKGPDYEDKPFFFSHDIFHKVNFVLCVHAAFKETTTHLLNVEQKNRLRGDKQLKKKIHSWSN